MRFLVVEAVDPEERSLRLHKLKKLHKRLSVASGMANIHGNHPEWLRIRDKADRASDMVLKRRGATDLARGVASARLSHRMRSNAKQRRGEQVDMHKRRVRIYNLDRQSQAAKDDAARNARLAARWLPSNHPHRKHAELAAKVHTAAALRLAYSTAKYSTGRRSPVADPYHASLRKQHRELRKKLERKRP